MGFFDLFVSEVDESDGLIVLFKLGVVVLNNIVFDYKSMEELRELFVGFMCDLCVFVVNFDNDEVCIFCVEIVNLDLVFYGLENDYVYLFVD